MAIGSIRVFVFDARAGRQMDWFCSCFRLQWNSDNALGHCPVGPITSDALTCDTRYWFEHPDNRVRRKTNPTLHGKARYTTHPSRLFLMERTGAFSRCKTGSPRHIYMYGPLNTLLFGPNESLCRAQVCGHLVCSCFRLQWKPLISQFRHYGKCHLTNVGPRANQF